jgi:branched-chain amino acid transport system substrate-binding protein
VRRRPLTYTLLLITVLLAGCSSSFEQLTYERAKRAKESKGDVVVAIVWDNQILGGLFAEGIDMAVEEINRHGRILDRRLRTMMFNAGNMQEELNLARKIAQDPDIVAVVGHGISDRAISSSLIYEKSGVLFLSPAATSPRLTSHGFQYTFRNAPSDKQTGHDLADFARASGFKKMVTIDDDSEYGQMLVDSFLENANKVGIEIKAVRSYFRWEKDYKPLVSEILSLNVDAVFIGGYAEIGSEVIKQARQLGLMVPFISGDGLDQLLICNLPGNAGNGVIVTTVYNAESDDDLARNFRRDFFARYKVQPDTFAAQGYDSMKLLATSFNGAKSTVPAVVSSYMRFMVKQQSIMGAYSFDRRGDVVGKKLYFKQAMNGAFHYLPPQ